MFEFALYVRVCTLYAILEFASVTTLCSKEAIVQYDFPYCTSNFQLALSNNKENRSNSLVVFTATS